MTMPTGSGNYTQPDYKMPDEDKPKPEDKPQIPSEVGNLETPAADVTPPELTYSGTWADDPNGKWQSGPEITLDKPKSGTSEGEVTQIPYVQPFSVNTGNIVDNVKLALTDIKTAVEAYNTHKQFVQEREGWIFSVASKNDIGSDNDPFTNVTSTPVLDVGQETWSIDESNDYQGASREMVTQLNTYQHQLLMAAADVITLVGQFNLSVDGAAHAYAQIDYSSQFPDPPVIQEIIMDTGGPSDMNTAGRDNSLRG